MARTPKKATGTAVANYDEELAKYATIGAEATASGEGGKFFSTKAGVLQYDDAPLPGNQMIAVIASWCLENVYYEGVYDAENRAPPKCFAFSKEGEDHGEMGPPEIVDTEEAFERQSDQCKDCWANQWNSSERGRGKACGNRRRLALLPAGTFKPAGRGQFELEMFEDVEHYQKAEPAFMKIPVTSGKGFDTYVRQVAETFRKPVFAVFTRIWLEPDAKSQFKVMFEMEGEVPNDLLGTLIARHKELDKTIDFPYQPPAEEDAPAPKAANKKLAGKGAAKPAARGKR